MPRRNGALQKLVNIFVDTSVRNLSCDPSISNNSLLLTGVLNVGEKPVDYLTIQLRAHSIKLPALLTEAVWACNGLASAFLVEGVRTRKCILCPSRANERATLPLPVQFIAFRHPRAFFTSRSSPIFSRFEKKPAIGNFVCSRSFSCTKIGTLSSGTPYIASCQ